MLPKLRHSLTNWVDGMKINRQHFIDSENALLDGLRDSQALSRHSYDYGLLQPIAGEKSALDLQVVNGGGKQLKISLRHCRAVTSGGCRIELIPGVHPELIGEHEIPAGTDEFGKPSTARFFAIVSIDPFARKPFGVAAADEYPPRNSYSISDFRLSLISEEELDAGSLGAFHLPIARFAWRNGELITDTSYIPPCATVGAHPGTRQLYNAAAERFSQIQEGSWEIVRKITEGGQNTALALNMFRICESGLRHISAEFFNFRTLYRQQAPVFVLSSLIQFSAGIQVGLNLLSAKDKEELLQYFSHWNELSPGRFEEMLALAVNADYEHEDIYGSFEPLMNFLKMWNELLEKLKGLKLIGQRKEGFDFGGRTVDTPKEKGKGKFSIFD